MEEVLDAKGGQFQEKGEQIMELNKQQTLSNNIPEKIHCGVPTMEEYR